MLLMPCPVGLNEAAGARSAFHLATRSRAMNRFKAMTPALVAGVCLNFATVAWGDHFRSKTDGPWEHPNTWEWSEGGHEWADAVISPGAGDAVRIRAGHNVVVSTYAEATGVYIYRATEEVGPGVLEITGGATLKVYSSFVMQRKPKETAPARLVFSGEGRQPGMLLKAGFVLDVYSDVDVVGAAGGVVKMEDPEALISIGRFARLTALFGPLTLDGKIEMDGTVKVLGPHVVRINGPTIGEGSSGPWILDHERAVLLFETRDPILLRSGQFELWDGRWIIATDLSGYARVTRGNGTIHVEPGYVFDLQGIVPDTEGVHVPLYAPSSIERIDEP